MALPGTIATESTPGFTVRFTATICGLLLAFEDVTVIAPVKEPAPNALTSTEAVSVVGWPAPSGGPVVGVTLSHVPPGSVIYDIVTHPHDTALLCAARAAGFTTIDGLAMLIGQAAAAFAKFFGQPAPREYDADLRELLIR